MYARNDRDHRDEDTRQIVDVEGAAVTDLWRAASLDALDSEAMLLGLVMMDAEMPPKFRVNLLELVSARLGTEPAVFQRPFHRELYTAMLAVAGNALLPDTLTVDAEMRRRNVRDYSIGDLSEMTSRAACAPELADRGTAAIESLCQNVLDAAARREYLRIMQDMGEMTVRGVGVTDIADAITKRVNKVPRTHLGADTTIAAVAENFAAQMAEWRDNPNALRGTTSGLTNIDKVTLGWQRGDLIVLAARMSAGKTAYALSFTLAAAQAIMERTDGRHNHQVGFISLEMDCDSLFLRLVAMHAGVSAKSIKRGYAVPGEPPLDWDAVEESRVALAAMPIRIVDAHGAQNRANGQMGQMTTAAIREHTLAWHREGTLDLLVVDFLNCIVAQGPLAHDSYERQIAAHTHALKNLASELKIPTFLLAQLNRENEHGVPSAPQLHHLRDSDAIGQFADVVMFPMRWDYYRERGMEVPDDVKQRPMGFTQLFIQKHRNGEIGAVNLYSDMRTYRVWDWSEQRNGPVDLNGRIITCKDERGLVAPWKPEMWPTEEPNRKGR